MKTLKKCFVHLLVGCVVGAGFPLPASAGIVATDQIQAYSAREKVRSFLDRIDVRARMEALGVDPEAARARVDALTDEEVSQLAGRIDQLPAGGDSVLGILFAIFIILLITDILGLTKVFPFTRSVR
jgi:hypothetical protein